MLKKKKKTENMTEICLPASLKFINEHIIYHLADIRTQSQGQTSYKQPPPQPLLPFCPPRIKGSYRNVRVYLLFNCSGLIVITSDESEECINILSPPLFPHLGFSSCTVTRLILQRFQRGSQTENLYFVERKRCNKLHLCATRYVSNLT